MTRGKILRFLGSSNGSQRAKVFWICLVFHTLGVGMIAGLHLIASSSYIDGLCSPASLPIVEGFLILSSTNTHRKVPNFERKSCISSPSIPSSPTLSLLFSSTAVTHWTRNNRSHTYNETSPILPMRSLFETPVMNSTTVASQVIGNQTKSSYTKSHSLTVCLVPPSPCGQVVDIDNVETGGKDTGETDTWKAVTEIRLALKDPGFFRWPPHVNLLYPFVQEDQNFQLYNDEIATNKRPIDRLSTTSTAILQKLRRATQKVEPFWVSLDLDTFGTFGDSTRGVLWAYPSSFRHCHNTSVFQGEQEKKSHEPIIELQFLLEQEFPMCSESLKERQYIPHMSMSSKFDSVDHAKTAATEVLSRNTTTGRSYDDGERPVNDRTTASFWCNQIYLLERDGDHGQFQRRATIALGNRTSAFPNNGILLHNPPKSFSGMPPFETSWVRTELQILKAKRKENRKNRGRRRAFGGSRSVTPRLSYRARKRMKDADATRTSSSLPQKGQGQHSPVIRHDTPETIAKKRAERKARRQHNKNDLNGN